MDKIHFTPVHPGEVLQDELDEIEGIKKVNVSAEKGIATIEYDEKIVDKMKIIEIIIINRL